MRLRQKTAMIVLVMVIATVTAFGMIGTIYPIENPAFAQQQEGQAIPFIVQNTTMSTQDPLPGHEAHQAVIAAPPREDGKIYSGVATFTASYPVEVVVLHGYAPSQTPDQAHGEPLNAPFGNGKVAISLMKKFTDSPINAGSFAFAGNALVFHTLDGKPFTVTYTIDAEVKSPTSQ
jgi:hypothetical protein